MRDVCIVSQSYKEAYVIKNCEIIHGQYPNPWSYANMAGQHSASFRPMSLEECHCGPLCKCSAQESKTLQQSASEIYIVLCKCIIKQF